MPQDILKSGLTWLTSQLAENAAQTVRYARGGDSVEVRAVFGEKLLRLEDVDGGIRMEWTDIDFCIPAAQLVLAGEPIEPERGDQIFVTDGDQTRVYEVRPFGSEAPWRWSDPHRLMVRVHTKLAESERFC